MTKKQSIIFEYIIDSIKSNRFLGKKRGTYNILLKKDYTIGYNLACELVVSHSHNKASIFIYGYDKNKYDKHDSLFHGLYYNIILRKILIRNMKKCIDVDFHSDNIDRTIRIIRGNRLNKIIS